MPDTHFAAGQRQKASSSNSPNKRDQHEQLSSAARKQLFIGSLSKFCASADDVQLDRPGTVIANGGCNHAIMSVCRFITLIRTAIASSCSQIISAIGMPQRSGCERPISLPKLALWIMAACVTARTSWMAFKTALAQLLDFTAEKISQVVRDED